MKTILRYLRPYLSKMILGISGKFLGTMCELLLPFILSHILEKVAPRQDLTQILLWGGVMAVCAVIAMLTHTFGNRTAAKVGRHFVEHLRSDLFRHTLHLSAAQTDAFTIPSLETRVTTDTYNVYNFILMIQRAGIRAPLLLIGGVFITLFMDRYLAIVMLAVMPPVFLIVLFISRKGVPLYSKVQKSADNMTRVVREDSQGIRVIKALSKTDYEHRRFDTVNRALIADEKRAGITMGSVNPIMTVLMNCGIVGVVALSANRVANGLSSPETVIAFMQYFTLISMAMMSVTHIFVMYTKCAASARRIEEVLQTPEDLMVQSTQQYPDKDTDAHIEFDHVNFSYLGRKNNLNDINFTLPKGGWLGIIGATGSGKSTLVRLLMRYYDVNSGAVRIHGRDVRTIPHEELCAMFGTAMQFDFLYSDTVEENIKFGRDLTHEQVMDAAITAQAHDFISAFSDGYEHVLSQKATNISGGQKQRLLIARAVAANPDILVLDDSSSALDYKTDAALRQALAQRMQGTTVVTVAQRVSSVKNCDLILVIDEGRIIGAGDHEHLLATCEEYAEISQSQMGGAFVE